MLFDRGYILIGADVSLTAATVPEGVYYVEDGAFAGCTSLSTVTFPAGTNMKEMFKGVFSGCTSLVSITLPQGLGEIWDFFFSGCSSLQTVNFPSGFYLIHDFAFVRCTALRTIELPETPFSQASCPTR